MTTPYKNHQLHRNSKAYELYQEALKTKDFSKLDKHLKEVDANYKRLHGL